MARFLPRKDVTAGLSRQVHSGKPALLDLKRDGLKQGNASPSGKLHGSYLLPSVKSSTKISSTFGGSWSYALKQAPIAVHDAIAEGGVISFQPHDPLGGSGHPVYGSDQILQHR